MTMELKDNQNTPFPGTQVEEDPNNNLKWICRIQGPAESPYAGGIFTVAVEFKENYPFKMPHFRFETKIYHPNIKEDTGEVCQEMIGEKDWVPTKKIKGVIELLVGMLINPNADSAINEKATAEFRNDRKQFDKSASEWTTKYAKK